jgi:hydroxymethylpyrimidine/phosphomethylpyrimidine kinase
MVAVVPLLENVTMGTPKRALTIAGSDSGGGAGIQADLKSFMAFGVYGTCAVTAVTAQNTLGVQAVHAVPAAIVEAQIESVMSDIGLDAAKTGMIASADLVELVAACVRRLGIPNLVVDPVMVATSGDSLVTDDTREALTRCLFPVAAVVTPNLPEAELLVGGTITGGAEMRDAARELHDLGPALVVIKGGHAEESDDAVDLVYDGLEYVELRARRVKTTSTHGTGCTFSAATAAGLALGRAPIEAIRGAKNYVTAAIASAEPLGAGHGPTNHRAGLRGGW